MTSPSVVVPAEPGISSSLKNSLYLSRTISISLHVGVNVGFVNVQRIHATNRNAVEHLNRNTTLLFNRQCRVAKQGRSLLTQHCADFTIHVKRRTATAEVRDQFHRLKHLIRKDKIGAGSRLGLQFRKRNIRNTDNVTPIPDDKAGVH